MLFLCCCCCCCYCCCCCFAGVSFPPSASLPPRPFTASLTHYPRSFFLNFLSLSREATCTSSLGVISSSDSSFSPSLYPPPSPPPPWEPLLIHMVGTWTHFIHLPLLHPRESWRNAVNIDILQRCSPSRAADHNTTTALSPYGWTTEGDKRFPLPFSSAIPSSAPSSSSSSSSYLFSQSFLERIFSLICCWVLTFS